MRRRNLIAATAMPYKTPGGYIYDCADFASVLDRTLALADWDGFPRRRASVQRSRYRGIGIALHCQRAGTASERMEIRIASDGSVDLLVGTLATGQGHETMFAQMVAEWLGLPMHEIRVVQGDTDKLLYGRGRFAQRSMGAGGSALKVAADDLIRKARRLAAEMLEASDEGIAFKDGVFAVKGTARRVAFKALAKRAYAVGLPTSFGAGLEGVGSHPGPNTYPNGCMIAEVEVDADTGVVRVERLSAVDDVGAIINPLTLHGQLHGSIAQGLGEVLMERAVYEKGSGQLLTGSFMDYAMPRADVMPDIAAGFALVPTKTNLLGVKGGSEAGNLAVPAAVMNAVIDALAPFGVTDLALPLTPEHVWSAIRRRSG